MPGTYDPETNTVWWGTANPAPLYDWAGPKWQTEGPRPGTNLYTSSVIALDPDTGQKKWHFQYTPHDVNDWDSTQTPTLIDAMLVGARRPSVPEPRLRRRLTARHEGSAA